MIVLTVVDGIKLIEYHTAISKYITPSYVISASRISNDRFCFFLNNQKTTDDLVEPLKNCCNEIEIPIRKLINPSKRAISFNFYPIVPDKFTLQLFHELNIRITSQISRLKSGFYSDQFVRIISFRRQMYINPEDFNILSSSNTTT